MAAEIALRKKDRLDEVISFASRRDCCLKLARDSGVLERRYMVSSLDLLAFSESI